MKKLILLLIPVCSFGQNYTKLNNTFTDGVSIVYAGHLNSLIQRTNETLRENSFTTGGIIDNTSTGSSLINSIGTTQKTLIVDGNYLLGTNSWPLNVNFIFNNSGILKVKNSSTLKLLSIDAGHTPIISFESYTGSKGNLELSNIQNINPLWFGLKANSEPDTLNNFNYLKAALYSSTSTSSEVINGSMIQFPSGMYWINGGLGSYITDTTSYGSMRFTDIVGAGQRKTVLKLANNQNEELLHIYQGFNQSIKDIGFDGNKTGNNSCGNGLIDLNYAYNFSIQNVHIENSPATALYIGPKQSNSNLFFNLDIESNDGWGIHQNQSTVSTYLGVDVESNQLGGLLISSTNTTGSLQDNVLTFIDHLYGEDTEPVLKISGTDDVTCFGVLGKTGSQGIYIAWDSLDNATHYGKRSSQFNHIFNYGSNSDVIIGAGNPNNVIITAPNVSIDENINYVDLDGRNSFISIGKTGTEITHQESYDGTPYFEYSNPNMLTIGDDEGVYRDSIIFQKGGVFNPLLSYCNGKYGYSKIYGWDDFYFKWHWEEDILPASDTLYFYLLIESPANNKIYISFSSSTDVYDFYNNIWGNYATNNTQFYFYPSGDLQFHKIMLITQAGSVEYDIRLTFEDFLTDQSDLRYAPEAKLYYVQLTDNPNDGFIHTYNSVIIGRGYDKSCWQSGSIPSATLFPVGTRNFCTDLGYEVISNGTNWKKPDGNNL